MNKKEQILNAALKLFVEFGFHGTPTSKIAKIANVSNGTLFNYFKTKDELIVELYRWIKQDLNSYLKQNMKEDQSIENKIKCIFCDALEWGLKNEDKISFIQLISYTPNLTLIPDAVKDEQSLLHRSLLKEAIQGKVMKDLPFELISVMTSSNFFATLMYLRTLPKTQRQKSLPKMYELFWNMVKV